MSKPLDPFLLAHCRAEAIFDIGGSLTPFSVRDQMIRAQVAIERALDRRLISAGRPLLIIGANASGVCAALHAARAGVPVTLCEREPAILHVFAGCFNRHIDPTGYDWPHPHWRRHHYPIAGKAVPIQWDGGIAGDVVVDQWLRAYADWERVINPALLKKRFGETILRTDPFDRATRRRTVYFSKNPSEGHSFSMILCCCGTGTERTWLSETSQFVGPTFWEPDDLDQKIRPAGSRTIRPRILICGGGDGALQDFLRAVTGRNNYFDLMDNLGVPDGMLQEVEAAQSQATRAHLWGPDTQRDHAALASVDRRFNGIVGHFWATQQGRITAVLDRDLLPSTGRPVVQLLHACSHFGNCYALNRFVVQVVMRYLDERPDRNDGLPSCRPNSTILEITSADSARHSCNRKFPQLCRTYPHRASIGEMPRCWDDAAAPVDELPAVWDAILVRFGPESYQGDPLGNLSRDVGSKLPPRRHVLPFYICEG